MADLIKAWRNLDGTYRLLIVGSTWGYDLHSYGESVHQKILDLGGRWIAESGCWIVPESAVEPLGANRISVVIIAGYCCEPVAPAEVKAYEVARGKLFRVVCPTCGQRSESTLLWEVPIIEFCGEGEEGRRTYEAVFQAEVEGH